MSLTVRPIKLRTALAWVERVHSHHGAPVGGLFAASVCEGDDVRCVAVVGRPVSRMLGATDTTAEVTRVASDGTRHAASMCLAAAARAALSLGYRRLVSYTLLGEAGTSYRAAGWRVTGLSDGGSWSRPSRERSDAVQPGAKARWETGPDAAPLDPEADAAVRDLAGKIALPSRPQPFRGLFDLDGVQS